MEFYANHKCADDCEHSFNSQRDGILRFPLLCSAPFVPRFNSQRDGILHAKKENKQSTIAFQFPTGWNSTQIYEQTTESWPSFNSQRDGILLKDTEILRLPITFQFPTGWNSTQSCNEIIKDRTGFNSQRDGILQMIPSL